MTITASVLFVGLLPLGATLVAVLVVLIGALAMSVSHRRNQLHVPTPFDPACHDLVEKMRHPWRSRARQLFGLRIQ